MVEYNLITLENNFENIKENVRRGLTYVIAINQVDELLRVAYTYSAYWMSINVQKAYLRRLNALIKQANQLKRDLKDLLELQKGILL